MKWSAAMDVSEVKETNGPAEATTEGVAEGQTHRFQAEVSQVLSLVINSLYSNKEIFLRELVSNASDALDKLRFRGITEPNLLPEGGDLHVRILADPDANTLTIWDNGIGMSREELVEFLGTVAHSGSRAFMQQLAEAKKNEDEIGLIGQFGVGFYSAYLVADRVDVISRAAGSSEAYRWSSDAGETFQVVPDSRDTAGTSVVLHLRDDADNYLQRYALRQLVEKYSDYVSYPIRMPKEAAHTPDDDLEASGSDETTIDVSPEPELETINRAGALWRRPEAEITDEQYNAFYKHVANDWEDPLARAHFKIEGTQEFRGLLFVPRRAPFDLFDRDRKNGVRLYVRRVFIMENCAELLPEWLRFVRGVIDSDDLPLNVSRELLQDSRVTKQIRKFVVKKVLDQLEDLAANRADEYALFWENFGRVLKEGVHYEVKERDRIAKLCRWETSFETSPTTFEGYKERMKEGQTAIYYALGPNRKLLESSPHLEALQKRGYEVLFLTDPIDQWVVDSLGTYGEIPLVSAMAADLDINDDPTKTEEERTQAREERAQEHAGLIEHITAVLGDRVSEVRVSDRLDESPVCLVLPPGGLPSHIERLLRANNQNVPAARRILEINPTHQVVQHLRDLHASNPEAPQATAWVELLYDQALLLEGSPIDDPARFARQMTALMTATLASPTASTAPSDQPETDDA